MNGCWILFYYNSLPDMPKGCKLFSKNVMHRDFFKCNPKNTGHYQYPKFETWSYDAGCHKREVNSFLERKEHDKYVVFYTRHTSRSGKPKNKIVGYFKVGKIDCFEKTKPGFYASKAVLLPKDECVKMNYSERGVPVSWGKSGVKLNVGRALHDLMTNSFGNIAKKYRNETKSVMKLLRTEYGRKEIIDICEECKVKHECYWGKKSKKMKRKQLNKLYGKGGYCGRC